MKLCKTCGAPMEDEATFCPMCGAKVADNNTSEETTVLEPSSIPAYVNVSQQPEPPKQKKKLSKGVIVIIVIFAILVLAGIGALAEKAMQNSKYKDDYSFSNSGSETYDNYDIGNNDNSNEKTFEFGTIENNSYSNSFADLHIDLPSDEWIFMTTEQIANDYLGNGIIDTENDKAYIENDSEKSYFDMVMYNTANNQNIQIQLMQGLTYAHKNSSAKDMLDAMLSQVDAQYSSLGYTVTGKKEYDETVSIGANDYYIASIDLDISDSEKTGQLYAVSKANEDTFVVIAISGSDKEVELLEFLNMLY